MLKQKKTHIMKTCLLIIMAAVSLSYSAYPEKPLFAPHTFSMEPDDDGSFVEQWYSEQFRALQEQSLFSRTAETNAHIYRFTCLRTFDHPFCIIVTVLPDQTATLTAKMTSGAGGYEPGKLVDKRNKQLSAKEVEKLLVVIRSVSFWLLPTNQKITGVDGSQWIIEGLKNGKYHIVDRFTPEASTPIGKIGRLMLELSPIKIEELY